ncbi:SDR family oxidoreductase [Actinospica sp. MGRD01-02]|uniref:SDR family oxidoreductase n=1 Tax=Actinospica acidithermotolerans TaxID=2828514 RepID=A0A941ILI0_9ACTN|nr:SDR family oxidoreductase [Actinospica acidithermotolerans]MBR7829078.1 SDR family oxidoreductase [Actinospica acidithermotolerans]
MTTALITGGTAGIGRAFADKFAALGYDLVLVARNQERLDEAAAELRGEAGEERKHGPVRVETLSADLATVEGRALVEERLGEKDRPVDILVNNAGFGLGHSFRSGSLDDEERLIDVHIRAVLRLTHAALPGMVLRGKGSVINVASVAAFVPRGTYSASKAWVVSFSESVAAELNGTGVRCMALCPGFTHTEFHDRAEVDPNEIPSWMWLNAPDVVDAAIDDLRKGLTVSVPSIKYKALVGASKVVPRRLSTRVGRGVSKRW